MMESHGQSAGGRQVIVAGGSFAGLAAAYTLRERLRPDDRVVLVSPDWQFVFAPSLIWAALGQPLLHSSFALEPALSARGIDFVRGFVQRVQLDERMVVTEDQELRYDRLLIATGGRPDTSSIPGVAGELRAASWVVGESSAMELRNVLRQLFDTPGPLVVGAAQEASYISAAYELALGLDTALRRQGLRDQVPMTFVTSEPYLGHFGFGQTAARPELEKLFRQRNIETRVGRRIEHVRRNEVTLSGAEQIEAQAIVIMPPFTGAVDIWKSADLTDEHGLISVDSTYRHGRHLEVYAAGVASYFQHPVAPLETQRAPHTGYLSTHMGIAAGRNIAASLGCGSAASQPLPFVLDARVLDGGDVGLALASWGRGRLRHAAFRLPGQTGHYLKGGLERYLLWRLRTGNMKLP